MTNKARLILKSSPFLCLIGEVTWCSVLCVVPQPFLTLCDPMDYSSPGSSVHGILQARILEWVAMPSSRGSPQPRIKPRSATLQADSLPSEPPGKPKNTGVGSLSLLQGIFPTQELNQCLFHCRQILYQLSCQGSPIRCTTPIHPWDSHEYFLWEKIPWHLWCGDEETGLWSQKDHGTHSPSASLHKYMKHSKPHFLTC